MAQIALGVDAVANPLFEHLGLRETTVSLALPDLLAIAGNAKNPAGARLQRDLAQVVGKRTEQFLRQPGSA